LPGYRRALEKGVDMHKAIALASVLVVALGGAVAVQARPSSEQAPAGVARSISIVKAMDDHGVIRLTVRTSGWSGSWLVYVNGRYNNFSTSRTKGSTNPKRMLAPGSYRIHAALGDKNRKPLRPSVRSKTVTVTVEEPAETTEG
jgi:hypothetical protein